MQPSDSEYILVRRDSLPNMNQPPRITPSAPPIPNPARNPTRYVVNEYQIPLRPPNTASAAPRVDPNAEVLVLFQEELKDLRIGVKNINSRLCLNTWISVLSLAANLAFWIYDMYSRKY